MTNASKPATLANCALPAHIAFSQGLSAEIHANLSDSTAQTMTLKVLTELANINLEQLSLNYGSLKGDSALRKAIIDFHQQLNHKSRPNSGEQAHEFSLDEDNALTFSGAQEALAAIYQTVLQPDDEVVVITPCYPSLVTMAKQNACIVKEIKLSPVNNWTIAIEDFLAVVNEKTKLIVVNSPHNPSGSIIDSTLAEQLLRLAKKFDCYLLADDVSQASNYHELSLAHNYLSYDKAIVISVLSKSFGLAGIRVGWALCRDKQLLKALLANKCFGSICCSTIDLYLAEAAIRNSGKIIAKNNQIIKENIFLFHKFIERNGGLFSWQPPQAGLLAIVECHFNSPIEDFARELAQHSGILLLPTSLFGLTGQYFRLGLGQANLCQTLEELQLFIDKCGTFIKN